MTAREFLRDWNHAAAGQVADGHPTDDDLDLARPNRPAMTEEWGLAQAPGADPFDTGFRSREELDTWRVTSDVIVRRYVTAWEEVGS